MKNSFDCLVCGGSGYTGHYPEYGTTDGKNRIPVGVNRIVCPTCEGSGEMEIVVECEECEGDGNTCEKWCTSCSDFAECQEMARESDTPIDAVRLCPTCTGTGYRPLTEAEVEEYAKKLGQSAYTLLSFIKWNQEHGHGVPFKGQPVSLRAVKR
jgi:RecJ-like exonuclease